MRATSQQVSDPTRPLNSSQVNNLGLTWPVQNTRNNIYLFNKILIGNLKLATATKLYPIGDKKFR